MSYLEHSGLLERLGASLAEQASRLRAAEGRLRLAVGPARVLPETLEGFGELAEIVGEHLEALAARSFARRAGVQQAARGVDFDALSDVAPWVELVQARERVQATPEDDPSITLHLGAIGAALAERTGLGARRQYHEVFAPAGARVLALRRRPLDLDGLSVLANGLAVDLAEVEIRAETAELERPNGWTGRVDVTYWAGFAEIPETLRDAALLALEDRWARSGRRFVGSTSIEDLGKTTFSEPAAPGDYLPSAALDLLGSARVDVEGIDVEALGAEADRFLEEVRSGAVVLGTPRPVTHQRQTAAIPLSGGQDWQRFWKK